MLKRLSCLIPFCNIARCKEIRNTDDSVLFRYETFIHFFNFSLSTRGERDTIFTMLTVPTSPTVNPQQNCPGPESNLNYCFFQKSPNSQPLASEQDVIHTPVLFLSGVFIMTFVIVISSAHERELYSISAPALNRIVQSPTKPNDKI